MFPDARQLDGAESGTPRHRLAGLYFVAEQSPVVRNNRIAAPQASEFADCPPGVQGKALNYRGW